MPTMSGRGALLVKPGRRVLDFVAMAQGPGVSARRAIEAGDGSQSAAGVTCRTH